MDPRSRCQEIRVTLIRPSVFGVFRIVNVLVRRWRAVALGLSNLVTVLVRLT